MSSLDIDLKVFAIIPTPMAWKCSVVFWNRNLNESQGHGIVVIPRKDFWKWRVVE